MKVETSTSGGMTIHLEPREVEVLRLALDRAGFIDTPPDRQDEILRFSDDLRRAMSGPARP